MNAANNAKSAVLLVLGLAIFAGILALTIDVVKETFQSRGTPLLRSETFRTEDTPFRSWTVYRVVFVIVLAMVVMSIAALTKFMRNRAATLASAASLLVLVLLVIFTPIGRYGLGASREIAAATTDDRFIRLESGVTTTRPGNTAPPGRPTALGSPSIPYWTATVRFT